MSRHAIETPVQHLLQCLDASKPANVAGAVLAARWLGIGALTGTNAPLADRLRALGISPPPGSLVMPVDAIGTFHLLDSDGATHRAFRVTLARHDHAGHDAWLDARSIDAWRSAREAARRVLRDFDAPDSADAIDVADGEPDWTQRLSAPIAGRSVSLPLALATLSEWLAQPLSTTVAATGDLDGRGNVLPAGLIAEKIRGLSLERPYVNHLLIPSGSADDLAGIPATLKVSPVMTLEQAARLAGLDLARAPRPPLRREDLIDAVRRIEDLAASRRIASSRMLERSESVWHAFGRILDVEPTAESDEAALTLVGRLMEYRTTAMLGDEAIALAPHLDRLRRRRPWLERSHPRSLVRALNAYASALIDAPRLGAAEHAAREALALAAPDGAEHLRVRGSLARVLAHRGAHLEAAETLTEVLAAQEREIPRESNLPRCCLIGTLVRLGRLAEARAVLDRGRDGQRSFTEHGWAAVNSRFLDYEEIRLLVAEHQTSEAIALAQSLLQRLDADDLSAPWPKIGVVNRLVEALLAEDRADEADERLARCSADVGPRRSRQMRWMFAQGESALAAWHLREGNGLEASRYLDRVRAACSEFAIDADAPYVDSARRIAAGEASPALLAVMRAGEIY